MEDEAVNVRGVTVQAEVNGSAVYQRQHRASTSQELWAFFS